MNGFKFESLLLLYYLSSLKFDTAYKSSDKLNRMIDNLLMTADDKKLA
ncbi:hypothetical protein AO385_1253 [Moraxella catarrhalis]|uniref:Uncharacterized protein n=1 Tax=Moraxella catarrhalis TaxID=480 RepID=A0A198UPJ3_MORCA|nr:hypothetical protein AO383_1180 [Moraxella catarrhalis]OAU98438.1 hypothetical protein AO384_0022 [Moraxella catarrhalis]OAV00184.1 hypothetical protein AO385_1253 [Moraxella catarrhalis]